MLKCNTEKFYVPAIWPKEYSAARVRRTECINGHEHYIQGQKGDQVVGPPDQLPAGVHVPWKGETKQNGTNQKENTTVTGNDIAGRFI